MAAALAGVWLAGLGGLARAADAAGDPAAPNQTVPTLTVVMDQGSILASQMVGFEAWVQNPGDDALTGLRLRLDGPSYLKLGLPRLPPGAKTPKCEALPDDGLALADLPARSAPAAPLRLCVLAEPSVDEADVTLALSLAYADPAPGGRRSGVVVDQEKLSVGVFGTESFAGVSLRLAGYFLPGTLMLMVLRLFKAPLASELETADAGVLGVLVSIVLSAFLTWFARRVPLPWLDAGAGVSASFLFTVCGLGLAIGAALVGAHQALLARQAWLAAQIRIEDGDAIELIVEKALRAAGRNSDPVTVISKTGRNVGAASAPTADGGVLLLGWYGLQGGDAGLRERLKRMIDARRYVEAVRAARKDGHVTITPVSLIRRADANGALGDGGADQQRIAPADLVQTWRGPVEDLDIKGSPPLAMA